MKSFRVFTGWHRSSGTCNVVCETSGTVDHTTTCRVDNSHKKTHRKKRTGVFPLYHWPLTLLRIITKSVFPVGAILPCTPNQCHAPPNNSRLFQNWSWCTSARASIRLDIWWNFSQWYLARQVMQVIFKDPAHTSTYKSLFFQQAHMCTRTSQKYLLLTAPEKPKNLTKVFFNYGEFCILICWYCVTANGWYVTVNSWFLRSRV